MLFALRLELGSLRPRIARQFGVSQANARKTLASDESTRWLQRRLIGASEQKNPKAEAHARGLNRDERHARLVGNAAGAHRQSDRLKPFAMQQLAVVK
jgi:hypothetical protein